MAHLEVPMEITRPDALFSERTAFALLRSGVPLTLLMDLAEEDGPRSAQHYASEGGDVSWVRRQG